MDGGFVEEEFGGDGAPPGPHKPHDGGVVEHVVGEGEGCKSDSPGKEVCVFLFVEFHGSVEEEEE